MQYPLTNFSVYFVKSFGNESLISNLLTKQLLAHGDFLMQRWWNDGGRRPQAMHWPEMLELFDVFFVSVFLNALYLHVDFSLRQI